MPHQLRRLALAFAAAFFLMALVAGYWGFLRRDELVGRADNARRILAERRARRGTIYDRNGAVLAESRGEPGNFERAYPYPDLAPVLGYVSPLYGSAGIEAAADGVLHGDAGRDPLELYWRDVVLGAPPAGRDVRLSIDLRLQAAADEALGSHTGAVVLLDAESGEILALASHPTYDANSLEAQWATLVADARAPLLNRATFALYQPGGAILPVTLAAALQSGVADVSDIFEDATAAVTVGNLTLVCRTQPESAALTLGDALGYGCPRPFVDLGLRMGSVSLDRTFNDFRLYEAPALPIPSTASRSSNTETDWPLAAIGQGQLNVTPLHLALTTAAIARRGEMPAPQLLVAEQDSAGNWQTLASLSHPIAALAPGNADALKKLMASGYSANAITGAGGRALAWFTGFVPWLDSKYAVAVLLEDGSVEKATQVGRKVLAAASGQP